MTMRKGGLGRGLDSLIINTDVSVDNVSGDREIDGLIRISLNDIKRNENQPRKVFNEEKIDELAESIREHGVIQPIIVMKSGIETIPFGNLSSIFSYASFSYF